MPASEPAVLDRLDRRILNLLQEDAAQPLSAMAHLLDTSVATCQRRIGRMQEEGIIAKRVALVPPAAVGLKLSVFVSVRTEKQGDIHQDLFVRAVTRENCVQHCCEISGGYDYLLLVHTADMAAYHAFTRRVLTPENNVRSFASQFVMKTYKNETKITV